MARTSRLLRRASAALLGLALAASAVVAHADPGSEEAHAGPARTSGSIASIAKGGATETGTTSVRPAANESAAALSLANRYRGQVGMGALSYDTSLDSALRAHANYVQLNRNVENLNPYTEEPGRPGYTTAGRDIAPYTSITFQSPTYTSAIELLLTEPWERGARFLDSNAGGMAVTRTTDFTLFAFSWGNTPSRKSFTFPKTSSQNVLAFESSGAPWYTGKCSQTSSAWGYPITAQFDWGLYDSITNVTSTLQRDGVPVTHCRLSDYQQTAMYDAVMLIPTAPLVKGAHYTGKVTAKGVRPDGTQVSLSLTIDFLTTSPVSKRLGDQTGDGIGDVLAVDTNGTMKLYKGVRPSTIGHGWAATSGWGVFSWIGRLPDVNGDGRDDLLARKTNGDMMLYTGRGMGYYNSGVKVGHGWNGLKNLTVVGDMVGNGSLNLVGVDSGGLLWRYGVTKSGISTKTQIGHGWNTVKRLTSVGSFDSGKTADIIGVTNDGKLKVYYSSGGVIVKTAQVGHGWGTWTALFSPGDLSGDGRADLIGRDPNGTLYSWTNRGGSWGAKTKAGTGWNGMRLFA